MLVKVRVSKGSDGCRRAEMRGSLQRLLDDGRCERVLFPRTKRRRVQPLLNKTPLVQEIKLLNGSKFRSSSTSASM